MAVFTCEKCGNKVDTRCKPKKCPACSETGSMCKMEAPAPAQEGEEVNQPGSGVGGQGSGIRGQGQITPTTPIRPQYSSFLTPAGKNKNQKPKTKNGFS